MLVLGIESSCDETAAAVVTDGWVAHSNQVASQAELHARFGGVVPEIASRRHAEVITAVIEEALTAAGTSLDVVDGIAVTSRPGLIGSLLVGVSAAKSIAFARDLPLVGVHHLEGHIFSAFLAEREVLTPSVALVASGGHTELYYVRAPHEYEILGRRRDDAAGEAFDKGARAMGLSGAGGPAIDRAARVGDPTRVPFPRARTDNPLDFSFSGLKTSLLRYMERPDAAPLEDVAASFQEAIVDVLVDHCVRALEATRSDTLLVVGGVAANSRLKARLQEAAQARGFRVAIPPLSLCTDNAAMIAAAGHWLLTHGHRDSLDLETTARAPLTSRTFALS